MILRGNRSRRRGFTIIELALVLVITAILATLAVVTYNKLANKARFTQAQTALKHLQKTETIYYTEQDRYTDNIALLNFDPTKYDYYQVSVVMDNTALNYTGYATGIGVMQGDLWFITSDSDPQQDNTSTFR
ncbi:MAG: prepilin-type N-terminal cleavage/methylation domain-containing protein [Deltaproteobacteria bacterium]|nr:prepilin-type N-terminal cleavage/methylation domain-containing protein [Deltaproteobacteria bacterium]